MAETLLAHLARVIAQDREAPGPRLEALPDGLRLALMDMSGDEGARLAASVGGSLADRVEHQGWGMVGIPLEDLITTLGAGSAQLEDLLLRLAAGSERQRNGHPHARRTVRRARLAPGMRTLLAPRLTEIERHELVRRLAAKVQSGSAVAEWRRQAKGRAAGSGRRPA
jgi:hypothetical protein